MQRIFDTYHRVLSQTDVSKKRYLFELINWKNRLIAITGQRGVGKTTLLLQKIKTDKNRDRSLYISADSLFIYKLSLFEIALNFRNNGGKYLYIDEVHKYPNWSGEIKHIYDTIPELYVVFTGSSILDIMKGYGDLSRRAVHYSLKGMSFREFLLFEMNVNYPVFSLHQILEKKLDIELDNPLSYFKKYLKQGFYPFYTEENFELKLLNAINVVLEVDLIQYLDLKVFTISKLKKLLQIISESVPFKPNISKIASLTQISRTLVLDYFHYLQRAGLIEMLHSSTKGIQSLGKPEKIYLNNTNLSYVLSNLTEANIGTIRETFFMSQLSTLFNITIPKKGDFFVEGTAFEIGGKDKTKRQIADIENSFVIKDDIEVAYKDTIPLWHFGFLY